MAVTIAILVLLAGAATAVPIERSATSECRRSCLLSEISKIRYAQGQTYQYNLEVESSVEVNNIHGRQAALKWTAEVDLHFETPCQVTLEIKNPRLEGQENIPFEEDLTRYPVRALMADGTVDEVCVDERDSATAVNIKKGILSSLQNSLPSNATLHDGIQISETDVVGVCPTTYRVRHETNKVLVEKLKDHRLCSERHSSPSVMSISEIPLKSPYPLKESKSLCKQEIENGIFKSVKCEDENEVSAIPGIQKTILAKTKSLLKFKSVSSSESVKSLEQSRKTNLLYDYMARNKNSSAIEDMEFLLRKMCRIINNPNSPDRPAKIFTDLIEAMDQVPENFIQQALTNIKQHKYCTSKAEHLESLYLDAVGYTLNNGAIPIMVEKILNQSDRTTWYTYRLHSIPRVCIHGAKAVQPLLDRDDLPIPVTLVAGSVIRRHCLTDGAAYRRDCIEQEPIKEIMNLIDAKIQSSCRRSLHDRKHKVTSLAMLKVVGNIKNVTDKLRSTILHCFTEPAASQEVRVAAALALSSVPCNEDVTGRMLEYVTGTSISAELRIFAYKAAVMCADSAQLGALIDDITQSRDVQARSYILSDLTNLQLSNAPYKVDISQRLAPFNISQDYSHDVRNNSQSIDFSTFSKDGLFGTELVSDFIFDNADLLPSQLRSNLTFVFLGVPINLLEMGTRFDNLPYLIENILGPDSSLGKTAVGRVIRNMLQSQSGKPHNGSIEIFLKFLGQEVFYDRFDPNKNLEDEAILRLSEIAAKVYDQMSRREHLENFKGWQYKDDIYVPTVQGIPLHIILDATAVTSLNAQTSMDGMEQSLKYSPMVSALLNVFVGYKFGPSVGFKNNNTIHFSSDSIFHVEIELPPTVSLKIEFPKHEADIFKFENKGNLITQIPGKSEKVLENSDKDPRLQSNWCEKSYAGMILCTEYDISNLYEANDYPLVQMSQGRVVLKKESSSMKGYELQLKKKPSGYQIIFDIPGTQNPTKFDLEWDYQKEGNQKIITVRSHVMQQSHGFQVIHKSDKNGGSQDIEIFSESVQGSQSWKKVFSSKFSASNDKTKLKIKTSGALQKTVKVDVDVEVLVNRPYSLLSLSHMSIKKFEVELAAAGFKSENYIRMISQSKASAEYSSQIELVIHGIKELRMAIKTTLKKTDSMIDLKNKVQLQHDDHHCETALVVTSTADKHLLSVQVLHDSVSKQFSLLLSDILDRSSHERKLSFVLEVPAMDIALKTLTRVKGAPGNTALDFVLRSGSRELLSVRGPLSWSWSHESWKESSQLGIRFGERGQTYHVVSEVEMSPQINYVKFKVNKDLELLVSYLHEVMGDLLDIYSRSSESSSSSIISKLELPSILKTDLSWNKTPTSIKSDVEVKLQVFMPNHIQSHIAMETSNANQGHISAKLLYDKSRDPEKSLQVSGTYVLEDGNHLSVQGEVQFKEERYHYVITSFLQHSNSWSNIEKHLNIELMKESEEWFLLRYMLQIQNPNSENFNGYTQLVIITPYKNEYSLSKEIKIINESSEFQLMTDLKIHGTTLGEFEKSLFVLTNRAEQETISVQGKLEAAGPNELESRLTLGYSGDVTMSLEKEVQRADIQLNVEALNQKVNVQVIENASEQKSKIIIRNNNQPLLEATVNRDGEYQMTVNIRTPSRSIKMEGRYDNDNKSLIIYPDLQQSQYKYDASIIHQSSSDNEKYQATVRYPHDGRQKSVVGSLDIYDGKTVAEVQLDVLSDDDNFIKIKINGEKVADMITRIEASILSDDKTDGPRLQIDISTEDLDKYVIAAYRTNSESAPTILLSSKCTYQSPSSAVVSFSVQTSEKKLELGGLLTTKNDYDCQGYALNSTIESFSGQFYRFEIETCQPGFIKIASGAEGGVERYVGKLGLETYANAEISLTKEVEVRASSWWQWLSGSSEAQREIPVIAVSAKVQRQDCLALRAQYDQHSLAPTVSLLRRELSKAGEATRSLVCEMGDRIASDVKEAFPELQKALDGISNVVEVIKEAPSVKKIIEISSDVLQKIGDLVNDILQLILNGFEKVKQALDSLIKNARELFQKFAENAHQLIEKTIHWIKTWWNSVDEFQLLQSEVQELVDRIENSSVGLSMKASWEQSCKDRPSQCQHLQSLAETYLSQLYKDLREYAQFLLRHPSVQYYRYEVQRWVDILQKKEYFQIIQSAVLAMTRQNVGVALEATGVQLNLPLRQPVSSVLAASSLIGFLSRDTTDTSIRSSLAVSDKQDSKNHPTWCTNYDSAQNCYFVVDEQQLVTVMDSKIYLPATNCSYILSKVLKEDIDRKQSVFTFNRSGTNKFSLSMVYKEHNMTLIVDNNKIYLDDVDTPGNFNRTFVQHEFTIHKNGERLIVRTPHIVWSSVLSKKWSKIMTRKVQGDGIGWHSYSASDSSAQLLAQFQPFKVDSSCRD